MPDSVHAARPGRQTRRRGVGMGGVDEVGVASSRRLDLAVWRPGAARSEGREAVGDRISHRRRTSCSGSGGGN
jgi:hypothetical protein